MNKMPHDQLRIWTEEQLVRVEEWTPRQASLFMESSYLPRAMQHLAVAMFMHKDDGPEAEIVRHQLAALHNTGLFDVVM